MMEILMWAFIWAVGLVLIIMSAAIVLVVGLKIIVRLTTKRTPTGRDHHEH